MLQEIIKKVVSFLIALAALIVLSPLFLIIAIAIKIDSRGPIFFIKERVGKNGKPFKFLKFRSMSTQAVYTINDVAQQDPHITRVGKFLREWTLDELPQLINVVKGDMSFVGPRPMPSYEGEDKNMKALWQKRISVVPGLVSLVDIKGRNLVSWEKRFEYDAWYADHQSFWLDMKILILGFFAVLSRRGVYGKEDSKNSL
ncbi:MAG: hypothetical protein A3A98_04215 [Candidatus Staskawiczbacteria bacterium RIFCSPLOWO2_01_FULL_40_39]|uniref:Bacterial sugar transferase domain-containing protein n=1 Tax=Candidatus Staskawiczbacteria bacterium RIFCSPHIGHO2_01_FULL_39_25 TaxID=1802202 RepID=A0A1G2HNT6_9BACT|nr:MAG: hypothetical protein A2730_03430 [Candidatus Staskawiczbacteria bacterium RIFCSPHIGHO2_01_FULL_39_25]OGZ73973.1 MAG: hypothetical protein A3A98_04215 [Candidatus Staskawiczbacteria bacterium RIFCSPLOWO2_01_FULL_40_39]